MAKTKPRTPGWHPADYNAYDIESVMAVAKGDGNPDQQKRAMDWIIREVCGTYELSFRSDSDGGERETAFAEGKRFAGMQIVKAVNMPPKLLAEIRKQNAK